MWRRFKISPYNQATCWMHSKTSICLPIVSECIRASIVSLAIIHLAGVETHTPLLNYFIFPLKLKTPTTALLLFGRPCDRRYFRSHSLFYEQWQFALRIAHEAEAARFSIEITRDKELRRQYVMKEQLRSHRATQNTMWKRHRWTMNTEQLAALITQKLKLFNAAISNYSWQNHLYLYLWRPLRASIFPQIQLKYHSTGRSGHWQM